MRSWRTASVALLSFSSGLPLGLVWIAIPDWMRASGVDIRIVGLATLAQAPWSFKILWSPLMDRYAPPVFGRRRGWAGLAQVALFALTLLLAGVGDRPDAPWVVLALALAIAFASATQDIAIDAYAVDVLRPDEQGVVVGARIAIYRAAMFTAGSLAITLAGRYSWPLVCTGLALAYLPMLLVTALAPEPERVPAAPRRLRDAVWLPIVGVLQRHRALEILAFVVLYKLADNLAQSLTRPFLIDRGYDELARGVALGSISLAATLTGTALGGVFTSVIGLGRALWVFGALQVFSNVGYVVLARSPTNLPLMYAANGFEQLTSGLGTGAFSVLLLRLTERRFSATQYALFSSLFGLPRLVSGPICGAMVDAVGWEAFYWFTIACGLPGLVLLGRFVPLRARDLPAEYEVQPAPAALRPVREVVGPGLVAGSAMLVAATAAAALLAALKVMRASGTPFDFLAALGAVVRPAEAGDWIQLAGIIVMAAFAGLIGAAAAATRPGRQSGTRSV
ncbi:MAG TPA: MFS transporter [Candidatus Limnocylindria bacterium]|nr:MFS transporter [Candidatus Limnocylindria bacterium]